jgi:hypothetical protein
MDNCLLIAIIVFYLMEAILCRSPTAFSSALAISGACHAFMLADLAENNYIDADNNIDIHNSIDYTHIIHERRVDRDA